MPATLPHVFNDGPGNTASGVEVMDNFNAINAGVFAAVVTVLPSSPVNGQDCYFLADATNGIVWHLKYRAASASASKWEVVGGASLFAEVVTASNETTASTTYATLTTAGPNITVPLAGDYDVFHGALMGGTAVTSAVAMSYDIGGAAAVDADAAGFGVAVSGAPVPAVRRRRKTFAAGVTLTSKYKVSSGTATFYGTSGVFPGHGRFMEVRPVRVG